MKTDEDSMCSLGFSFITIHTNEEEAA